MPYPPKLAKAGDTYVQPTFHQSWDADSGPDLISKARRNKALTTLVPFLD